MSNENMKFWLHRDKVTGKYYQYTNYSIITGDFGSAHIYRKLNGAKSQINGRVRIYKEKIDRLPQWEETRKHYDLNNKYYHDLDVQMYEAAEMGRHYMTDPKAYVEIVEVNLENGTYTLKVV